MHTPDHYLAQTSVGATIARRADSSDDGAVAGLDVLEYLVRRGVSDEVAAARGYGLTDGHADLPDVPLPAGARAHFDAGMTYALTIPLVNPAGEKSTVQFRFDGAGLPLGLTVTPGESDEIDFSKEVRFATPPGVVRRNRAPGIPADIHPLARPLLEDRTVPMLITEGVVKADAALSAARRESTPLCTAAITGVTMLVDSSRNGGRTVLHPETWGEIAEHVQGRTVILAWDADATAKAPVAQALQQAAHALIAGGADVRVWIAPVEVGAKAGLDDFLIAERERGARAPIRQLLKRARAWSKVEAELSKAELIYVARNPRPVCALDLAEVLATAEFEASLADIGFEKAEAPALLVDDPTSDERMIQGWTLGREGKGGYPTIDAVVAIDERGGQRLLARTDEAREAMDGARAWDAIACVAHLLLDGDTRRAAQAADLAEEVKVTVESLLAAVEQAGEVPPTVPEAIERLRRGEASAIDIKSQDGTPFVARFNPDPERHGWYEAVWVPSPEGGYREFKRRTAWLGWVDESVSSRRVAVDGSTTLAAWTATQSPSCCTTGVPFAHRRWSLRRLRIPPWWSRRSWRKRPLRAPRRSPKPCRCARCSPCSAAMTAPRGSWCPAAGGFTTQASGSTP